MTIARAALAASALFLVFMLGMATAPAPPLTVQPLRAMRVADLRLDPPGPAAAAAVSQDADAPTTEPSGPRRPLALAQVAPPPVAAIAAPPPPEVLLRQAVAAVTEEGGRLGLVLTGASGRRLHEGDSFMGWRLASVTRSSAVLMRGRERRETSFFGSPTARAAAPTTGAASFPPPPARPAGAPPTAAEFFRGFKG